MEAKKLMKLFFMSPDKKKLYMWLSVGTTTMVIAIIWFASIRYNISASIVEVAQSKQKGMEVFSDFENNFKKQFEDMQSKFNAPAAGPELSRGAATSTATSTK